MLNEYDVCTSGGSICRGVTNTNSACSSKMIAISDMTNSAITFNAAGFVWHTGAAHQSHRNRLK